MSFWRQLSFVAIGMPLSDVTLNDIACRAYLVVFQLAVVLVHLRCGLSLRVTFGVETVLKTKVHKESQPGTDSELEFRQAAERAD